MDKLNVRNKTQIKTWWKWYRNGETHRFYQQVGKQYSYDKGHEKLNSEDKLKLKIRRQQAGIDILKSIRNWKECMQLVSIANI